MNRNLKLAVASIAAALAVGPVTFAETFIVKDGKPNAEIVVSKDAARATQLAADFLADSLEKMTGAKLAVVTTPSGKMPVKVYVGPSQFTEKLGIETGDLDHDAFRMKSGDDYLALVGRDTPFFKQRGEKANELLRLASHKNNTSEKNEFWEKWYKEAGGDWAVPYTQFWKDYSKDLDVWAQDEHGTFSAVADFLRSLGMRFYMPTDLGKVIPKKTSIPLPKVDKKVEPDFPVRFANRRRFNKGDEVLWEFWMGFNRAADVIDPCFPQHGINAVTDHRTEKSIFAHPRADRPKPAEYYALYGGKRNTKGMLLNGRRGAGKQCLSSPKLIKENARYARARFDVLESPMVGVMPSDGYTAICQCELCQGKDSPELGYTGNLSNYQWGYVDKVARETYKTHPDKMILGTSYGTYRAPPTNIDKFSPNVKVCICQHRCQFGQRPEQKESYVGFRKGFLDKMPKGKNLLMYEYYRGARHTPHYNPHAIAEDLKALKGVGLGDMIDVDSDGRGDMKRDGYGPLTKLSVFHLDQYVTGRFLYDADLDVDAMLEEYYEKFYGPAAKEMKALVEYGEANWMDIKTSKEKIDKTLELLKAVQDKVDPDTVYGKRVALISDYIEPLRKLRDKVNPERGPVPEFFCADQAGKKITIDGDLDDPFWKTLPKWSKAKLKNFDGTDDTKYATSVMVGWANGSLYFGIRCEDVKGAALNIGATRNEDTSIWNGDCVEIELETHAHSYYQIAINPAGAVTDLDRSLGKSKRMQWTSETEVATRQGDGFWTIEARVVAAGEEQARLLPFQGVAGDEPTAQKPWFFNVGRQRVRDGVRELSILSPSGKEKGGFHDPLTYAKLVVGKPSGK